MEGSRRMLGTNTTDPKSRNQKFITTVVYDEYILALLSSVLTSRTSQTKYTSIQMIHEWAQAVIGQRHEYVSGAMPITKRSFPSPKDKVPF